jgi:PhzF family phenazine biosynthesis protein
MSCPLFVVDAFTDHPFAGNPAAVCLLSAWREDRWLQNVAREMNLSETAFLVRAGDGFELRWFTPTVEVDLCGHATLASAHVLWQQGLVPPRQEIRLATRSGILTTVLRDDGIEMDFPRTVEQPAEPPANLTVALGVTPKYVGNNRFDYLLEVDSEEALRGLAPDFALLATLPVRGVIVTSRSSDPRFDFVSRFFAPAAGINEDPVTGSAHCCLGDFWHKKLGKRQFLAYQASARGGVVRLQVGDERVQLGGKAVTVTRGELVAD